MPLTYVHQFNFDWGRRLPSSFRNWMNDICSSSRNENARQPWCLERFTSINGDDNAVLENLFLQSPPSVSHSLIQSFTSFSPFLMLVSLSIVLSFIFVVVILRLFLLRLHRLRADLNVRRRLMLCYVFVVGTLMNFDWSVKIDAVFFFTKYFLLFLVQIISLWLFSNIIENRFVWQRHVTDSTSNSFSDRSTLISRISIHIEFKHGFSTRRKIQSW